MGFGRKCAYGSFCTIFLLFMVVGIPLLFRGGTNNLAFTIESAAIKAYNLTSDNRLFSIFNFSIRAHNHGKNSVTYEELNLQVRNGKRHKLADDVITPFRQAEGNEIVVDVEAVGLYVQLKDEIAGEMRGDRAVGATIVSIFFSGSLGRRDSIEIKCRDVKVFFEGFGGEFVKVGCNVNVYHHLNVNDPS